MMKKEVSINEHIQKFIELSELHGKYLLSGEFRKNNVVAKNLQKWLLQLVIIKKMRNMRFL